MKRTHIWVIVLGLMTGCSTPSVLRYVDSTYETLTSNAVTGRKVEPPESADYMAAMQETVALTNGLSDFESAYRFIFHPSLGPGPLICIRLNRLPDGLYILTTKMLTQRPRDLSLVPDRLVYSRQELITEATFEEARTAFLSALDVQPTPRWLGTLDGVGISFERAVGTNFYVVSSRTSPDPARLQRFLDTHQNRMRDSIRPIEPDFDVIISRELKVHTDMVRAIRILGRTTGIPVLQDYEKRQ